MRERVSTKMNVTVSWERKAEMPEKWELQTQTCLPLSPSNFSLPSNIMSSKIQQNVKWSSSKGSITRERRVRRQKKKQGKAYRKTEKAKDKWRGFLILPFLPFLVHRLLFHRVLLSSSCRSLLHCFTCLSYWRFFPWMTMSWMLFFSAVLLQVLVVFDVEFSSLSSLKQDVNPSP